jgi:hypothetical protein
MIAFAYEGWRYRAAADGENAIRAFEEGAKAAQLLNEPCWVAYYQYWASTIHLFTNFDYQKALDTSVRLVAELRKEKYQPCPVRRNSADFLAKVYSQIDFFGYEDEIDKLMEYIENEIGVDNDTLLQIMVKRVETEIAHERYPEAREKLALLLNHKPNNSFRYYDAYCLLREVAFAEGDLNEALSHCRSAKFNAGLMAIPDCIALERIWEAVLLKYTGDEQAARENYYAALAYHEQYHIPLENEYYNASIQYLMLDKQFDVALKSSEALLEVVNRKPSLIKQMDAYIIHLRLLGRCAKDFAEPLARAKALANTSRKPEAYLKYLRRIENGDYFEFAWQNSSRKNQN